MKLTRDQLIKALYLMEKEGGHFASKLAKAWYAADSSNQDKLFSAFSDLVLRYHRESENRKNKSIQSDTEFC